MVTEERMKTLFARANPAPDASAVELDPLGATAYLETLEQRSSNMTQLDTQTPRASDSKKPRLRAALVGAAAVVVIGVVGIFVAQNASDGDLASEDFFGVWHSNDGVYMDFNEDGTYTGAWTLDELAEGTLERGTWSFDGTEFRWVATEGKQSCLVEPGLYTVERSESATVTWTVIWDPCLDRLNDLNGGPMVRISQ